MSDLRPTIVPKSDQLNADDLIGRTLTIKITSVGVKMDEQPVAIHFEGDNNKPYKPGKSMRRVLVNCWGPDANQYVGRSLTLYRDEKVQFGGLAVGGIRISHMSDIPKEITMALTVTRANKRAFTVKPMATEKVAAPPPAVKKPTFSEWLGALEIDLNAASTTLDVGAVLARSDVQKARKAATGPAQDRLQSMIDAAIARAAANAAPADRGEPEWDPEIENAA